VRAIILVTVVVIVAAWAMFRRLPESDSNAEAAASRPTARIQEVRSISLDGHDLQQARLRAVLETHAGTQLDTPRLERDREAMERALADLGYLAARVDPAIVSFDPAGAAYITFEIDQGRLFHLRKVEVTGPGKASGVVTISPGDDAIRGRLDSARQSLRDSLALRGKPATVELSVRTDLGAAAVDVVLTTR
jgi:outer membrane protein assembly factor BamA